MTDHPLCETARKFYNKINDENVEACRLNDDNLTPEQKELFDMLSEEIRKRYHGTGIVIPENLTGKRVLDIGCGSGSLVFMLSKLVGPTGYVIGIDICDGLLKAANEQTEYHTKLWGYDKPNFEFRRANIEKMLEEGFEPESFDIVVSNGVFCILPDKVKAFRTAYILLKEGGQFLLNDVNGEKDIPEENREHGYLWSMGIGGSLRWDTVAPIVKSVGFTTPHLTCAAPVKVIKEEYSKMLDNGRFACSGWRLFKLEAGPTRGVSSVTYKGNITGFPEAFPWDVDLTFKKGEPVKVDSELATLLSLCYLKGCFTFDDASGSVVTKRNQNPFAHMDKMADLGKLPDPIYKLK